LADLGNPFFNLSLLGLRPALQDSPMPYPLWKSVLAREGDGCLGPLLGQESFPAELVQPGSQNPGGGQAEGIR